MKAWSIVLLSIGLAACATPPAPPPAAGLADDSLFGAPSEHIGAADVFTVSAEMRQFLNDEISPQTRVKGAQRALIEALQKKGQLKLEYDSVFTRNAAQAFSARSGNCLSLVIMMAAMAKELGVAVQYQKVLVDETWTRDGNIVFNIDHVNLNLGRKSTDMRMGARNDELLTVDFLPPEEIRGQRTSLLTEERIVAMYMNNRAAESLARAQLDDAYAWAHAATLQDPAFLSAANTLGVVYRRHGNLEQAERAFRFVLVREPDNTRAMANLAQTLGEMGRDAESAALQRKLAALQPDPPFVFFNQGVAAMRAGDYKSTRALFSKEVDRAGYYHEFHYWLALAHFQLGDYGPARKHLALAMENSTTRHDHDLYAAKLDRINAHPVQ